MHEAYIIDCSRSWVSVLLDFLLSFKEETFKYCKYDVAFLALVVVFSLVSLNFVMTAGTTYSKSSLVAILHTMQYTKFWGKPQNTNKHFII